MSGQSRKMSALESVLNVLIGFMIAVTAQIIVFPWFGVAVDMNTNLKIGAVFTVISIVRSYMVRRFFNWLFIVDTGKQIR